MKKEKYDKSTYFNRFIDLIDEYKSIVKLNIEDKEEKKSLFKFKKDNEEVNNEVNTDLLITNFKTSIELSHYLNNKYSNNIVEFIEDYVQFLLYVEKCYFYENTDEQPIYCEMTKDSSTLYIVPLEENIKIKVEIEESVIDNISDDKENSLFDFLNDIEEDNTKLKFLNITIIRKYGKEIINEFRIVNGEIINLGASDAVLFNNTMSIIKQITFNTLVDILDNVVGKFLIDRCNDIKVKDLVNNQSTMIKVRNSMELNNE